MASQINELEPDAPDWSRETRSDDLLKAALQAKLDKSLLKRSIQDWRERRSIKRMVKRLEDLGI